MDLSAIPAFAEEKDEYHDQKIRAAWEYRIRNLERQQEDVGCLDPYSIFKYAMNSPVTRDRYTTRLDRFFSGKRD
jgi:hypothetical protein